MQEGTVLYVFQPHCFPPPWLLVWGLLAYTFPCTSSVMWLSSPGKHRRAAQKVAPRRTVPQDYGQGLLPSPLTQQLNTGHIFCLRVSRNSFQRSLDWENQTPVEVSLHLVRDLSPFHQGSCLECTLCKSSPTKADNMVKLSEIIISQVEVIHTESLLFNSFCHFWSIEFTIYSSNRQAATSKPCNSWMF